MPQQELKVNLIKGDRHGSNVDYRDNIPVNMSAVIRPILGAEGYMHQEPGLASLGTGSGIDTGGIWNEQQELHFRVSGADFGTIAADGTWAVIGTVGASAGPVSLPYSTNTQGIIINNKFWLYDAVNGLREVTDPQLGNPIDGVWTDALYVMTDGDFLFHTDAADESSIDPLKFSGSDFSPDPILGVGLTTDNKLMAFNRYSIEFFVNEATADFQFTRIPSRNVKYGLVATHLKAEIGGQWFFVGGPKNGDVSVYALESGGATSIASRDVVKILQEYTEDQLANAWMEIRKDDDYAYIFLQLPDYTLKCNLNIISKAGKEMAWSKLKTDTTGDLPWRAAHGVYDPRLAEWVYGDKRDSTIGTLDESVSTQYGEVVEWILDSPFIYLETASLDELTIFTIPGFATVDDGSVQVSLTYDGVHYGTEASIDYGGPSDYSQEFTTYRLGYVDDWFSLRLRSQSTSRMAFSMARFMYG
tara:strand:- start:1209 stop:2627 length:1419 start_codon:yes stop_codon:yes gene_type:complete